MALSYRDDIQLVYAEQDHTARRDWLVSQRTEIEQRIARSGFATPGDAQRLEQINRLLAGLKQQHTRHVRKLRYDWQVYCKIASKPH